MAIVLDDISVIDFESISLGSGSYPIEIACSKKDGSIESYLISTESVGSWRDWSAKSEVLHGISREHLIEHGLPPKVVVERVLASLRGRIVLSDNPDFDNHWLGLLFKAGGVSDSEIKIQDLKKYFVKILDESGLDDGQKELVTHDL